MTAEYKQLICLIAVCDTGHTGHDSQNVVVDSVDANLSGGGTGNSGRRKNKLKNGIVNSGEIACTTGLVLFGAKGEGVNVDTSVRGTGVVLVRLDNIEVCSLTLRESVLAVKLELTGDNRVLTPAVEVEGSLGKNECSGIRHSGHTNGIESGVVTSGSGSSGTLLLEHIGVDEACGTSCGINTSEGLVGVRKSINGIGVVERLSTKSLEKSVSRDEG